MSEQTTDQARYSWRHRQGVAHRLERLETRIDAITLAIAMMLDQSSAEAHKEEQRNAADGLS